MRQATENHAPKETAMMPRGTWIKVIIDTTPVKMRNNVFWNHS